MHEGHTDFIQTVTAEDVIPEAFTKRLQEMSQGYITVVEDLQRDLTEQHRHLDHTRKLQARYASLCRRRTEIAVAEAARDRLAILEEHERHVRDTAQVKADALEKTIRIAACEAVANTLCDIVETSLYRIMETIQPRERIAGIVRAALRDANLNTHATLTVSAEDKADTVAALENDLGETWAGIIELEVNPTMDRGILTLTTSDGTQMIGHTHQVSTLIADLRLSAQSGAPHTDGVLPA